MAVMLSRYISRYERRSECPGKRLSRVQVWMEPVFRDKVTQGSRYKSRCVTIRVEAPIKSIPYAVINVSSR